MLKKIVSSITLVAVLIIFNIGLLWADNHHDDEYYEFGDGGLFSTSTTTTTTAVTVGGIVLTVLLVTNSSSAELETYMRNNAVALQHDITVGGGDTINDLAQAFQISEKNLPEFASLLRDNRSALFPLTNPELLNEERAAQFAQTIIEAMANNASLANDLVVISAS